MTTTATLAYTLEQIGVHFIARPANESIESVLPPDSLLCGLASSDEARMRLSLIPLFLNHPDYAEYVAEALNHLTLDQQQLLRCYYTAAQLLQQKHHAELNELFGDCESLPALFDETLGIDEIDVYDGRLQQLAKRQAQLSGRPINWYGTYEHAYTRMTRHARKRREWQL